MKRVGNNHGVSQKYSKMMQKRRLALHAFSMLLRFGYRAGHDYVVLLRRGASATILLR